MKLAVMQPYVFPYFGYIQLINSVDKFVLLDNVNYFKGGYINRNNILMNDGKYMFTMPLSGASQNKLIRDIIRKGAKEFVGKQIDQYIKGRLGLIIDATGRDYGIIQRQSSMLKLLGYDCYMVFVNTSLDVALERNRTRSRSIPEYIVSKSWKGVQANMGAFQRIFGPTKMLIVDNNRDEKELVTSTLNTASKFIRSRLRTKPESHIAMSWIKRELELKARR